jgi:hypothetical protein
MSDSLDLSSHDACITAAARALQLRFDLRAGYMPTTEEARWLADVAYAALISMTPQPGTPAILLTLPDSLDELPEAPPWLRRLQDIEP